MEFHPGDPGDSDKPLLNHVAVLVDEVDPVIAEAEKRDIVDNVVDAANTRAVFVWGPERVRIEYVEHKPGFALEVVIAGAGMAGLSAAARARELGATPLVYEKGTRPGGSMLLSSCVIWRFREWDDFRAECPTGDEELQRVVWEQLDDGIAWLESLGAPVVQHETGNPRTIGKRFDPRGLTDTLVRAAGGVRLGESAAEPTILATGGFQGNAELVAKHIHPAGSLRLRANPWSSGDGMRYALERGAELSARAGGVLRAQHARRGLLRGTVRPACAAVRPGCPRLQRAGRGVLRGRGVVVGERPRAGDGAAAGRTRVVRAGRRARSISPCATAR